MDDPTLKTVKTYPGSNHLGKLLMLTRSILKADKIDLDQLLKPANPEGVDKENTPDENNSPHCPYHSYRRVYMMK